MLDKKAVIKPLYGLRFILVTIIFFYHTTLYAPEHGVLQRLLFPVTLLFILSGYTLAYRYHNRLRTTSSVFEFYKRRLFHIFPIHLITLLVSIPLLYPPTDLVQHLVPNVFLIHTAFPNMTHEYFFNTPAWFLSTILFLYMLFPFIIFLFSKIQHSRLLVRYGLPLLIIIIYLTTYVTHMNTSNVIEKSFFFNWAFYKSPYIRIVDFLLGILLYFFSKDMMTIFKKKQSYVTNSLLEIIALGLLVLTIFSGNKYPLYWYEYSIKHIPAGVIVLFVMTNFPGFLARLISHNIVIILSQLTLPFFMFQWILIHLAMKFFLFELKHNYVAATFLLFVFTLFMSGIYVILSKKISHHLLHNP